MNQNEYLEKLLDAKFNDLKELFATQFATQSSQNSKEHCAIVTRLDYTNGKVRRLEIWKGWLTGGLAALTFLAGISITILKIK